MDDSYQKELEQKLSPLGYNELIEDYEARKNEDKLKELNTRLFAELRKNYALEQQNGRLSVKVDELTKENRKLKKLLDKVVEGIED